MASVHPGFSRSSSISPLASIGFSWFGFADTSPIIPGTPSCQSLSFCPVTRDRGRTLCLMTAPRSKMLNTVPRPICSSRFRLAGELWNSSGLRCPELGLEVGSEEYLLLRGLSHLRTDIGGKRVLLTGLYICEGRRGRRVIKIKSRHEKTRRKEEWKKGNECCEVLVLKFTGCVWLLLRRSVGSSN